MPIVLPNGIRYETVDEWAEVEFGISKEQITPAWNINHYRKLLTYTKHSVRRKKIQKELNWWLEVKEFQDS